MGLLTERNEGVRLGDFLIEGLRGEARSFRGAAAFVRASGMAYLQGPIRDFSVRRPFELIAGVDLQGTSIEALEMLLDSLGANGAAFVFHNERGHTFHPKLYRFQYEERTELYAGSGNLTRGGLFTNHEAGLTLSLQHEHEPDQTTLEQIEDALDGWSANAGEAARRLDRDLIRALAERGLIQSEVAIRNATAAAIAAGTATTAGPTAPLFGSVAVPVAPATPPVPPRNVVAAPTRAFRPEEAEAALAGSIPRFFVMTLQQTDVGRGQTTRGAAARSPEIFIPLAARDQQPQFWGWNHLFQQDRTRPGKFDRVGVPFFIAGQTVSVNMMTWPAKHDFRLRSEALRSAGNVGDILLLERSAAPGIEYVAEVVPAASVRHAALLARCNNAVRNSPRRFGYF